MNKNFVFQIIAILWTWIRTAALLFPLTFALVSIKQGKLKYGYDFFEVDYRWALMISLGIAMALVVWTAMEFANLRFSDLSQYLKSRQRHYYHFNSESPSREQVAAELNAFADDRRWKISAIGESWELIRRAPYLITDKMSVVPVEGGLQIESAPRRLAFFVDAGRNFKHVVELGDQLRKNGL